MENGTMENTTPRSSLLPDPTADLYWSQFAGAIQDIFATNADAHPNRLCVVETTSSTNGERSFTYSQINEASNQLAHHLLTHGIERGEVVMIYAYRGVDLVVSIMGILKAGAALSVVDPAYPADRQIIYLDVAQPRALIVIDKALREEGGLSSRVTDWISSNLDLRTTVPGLQLLDNGSLRGGHTDSMKPDILYAQTSLRGVHPNVVVGPDTQPTLSFTSGSEGVPKGCKGRHFSLTFYQKWMAERFGLGPEDRFTMLSGIAHDPIQRDIFTPLYLGAQILVPAKSDIQHERLAEWMREYKATVTHLTPAMGQILVGGASAVFGDLHHAFFVGDILIKRDVRLLQNLAPNCRTVNMFGTTETQRAVSYFEIPSRAEDAGYLEKLGDVIPAGRGMKDVQLLVVDRESLAAKKPRLCNVGESGEIYVRAGGLADGYLGSEELNSQKFIPNFFLRDPDVWQKADEKLAEERNEPWREFWKGPRDRLYRSGDLGRYTSTGDVECTGRADNQVKIRGFRVELGDIDTHLSQHALVLQNLTLVRRDKDEEPILVSYLVPNMENWSRWREEKGLPRDSSKDITMASMLTRFRALVDDAKVMLRDKVPGYMVPSVFIPLERMPLNPNGKIFKQKLPYPDSAELAAAATAGKTARSQFSETEKYVGETWAQRIPGQSANTIDLDDRFFDIGGHSMIGQSILFDVRKQRNISLSMATLFQNPTVREFASVLDAAPNQSSEVKSDTAPPEMDYHLDGKVLQAKHLKTTFPSTTKNPCGTFLVTGASGFLGAHILAELLARPHTKIIVLVRAASPEAALQRIKTTCLAYSTWSPSWSSHLECVTGDLAQPFLGLSNTTWTYLEDTVDVVIHNGARVHWIHSYSELTPTNVLATIECIKLCAVGRPKHLTFISSTAVLDTPAYLNKTVLESDDLSGSRKGLNTGYAQTKYVSEYLVREAGARGLRGSVVRPGYITGNASTGIGPTDDFLLRMLKGSIQLGCRPDLSPNTINLVPVPHCARIVVASSLYPPAEEGVAVVQVTPHPPLPFNEFTGSLETYGYDAPLVSYAQWKKKLEDYVTSPTSPNNSTDGISSTGAPQTTNSNVTEKEPHALLPLFDWVTDNLPAETVSRVLDDRNARAVLRADDANYEMEKGSQVTQETLGMYLAFMASIGFIEPPPNTSFLPKVDISEEQKEALKMVGRGGGK